MNKSINNNMKEKRKRLGLSQAELASECGLSQSVVSRIERGQPVHQESKFVVNRTLNQLLMKEEKTEGSLSTLLDKAEKHRGDLEPIIKRRTRYEHLVKVTSAVIIYSTLAMVQATAVGLLGGTLADLSTSSIIVIAIFIGGALVFRYLEKKALKEFMLYTDKNMKEEKEAFKKIIQDDE